MWHKHVVRSYLWGLVDARGLDNDGMHVVKHASDTFLRLREKVVVQSFAVSEWQKRTERGYV